MPDHTQSFWRATRELPRFEPLPGDRSTDVAVIGGGISGLTAAVLLAREGRRVIVLEMDAIGSGETGNTTSHLTEAIDGRYQRLIKDFGEEQAVLVGRGSRAAIDQIEAIAGASGIDCGFARVPGFLYTERESDVSWLARELDAAQRAGCPVAWVDEVPVPFRTYGGVRWDRQAQVHATSYLQALVQAATALGVRVHERTRVIGVHDGEPCRVETEQGEVTAAHVFVAANVPVNNRVLLHTKITAYRSYAIAAEYSGDVAPERAALHGLFWDTDDPYHYTRTHEVDGRRYVIIGGEDHRTGEDTHTDACYARLLEYARTRFGITAAAFRWSGQIIEPVDGLPYIGTNAVSAHVYVATGYSGNGMTFGTLAGMIVSDLIAGRANPYAALFDATRVKPLAAAYDYVTENVAFPAHLVKDRLTSLGTESRPIESLRSGEGGIFATSDGKLAVSRDAQGALRACSAVCTHLGCDVAWNEAESTWDCPCHGSRFSPEGKVINGPAVIDLEWRPLPTTAPRR